MSIESITMARITHFESGKKEEVVVKRSIRQQGGKKEEATTKKSYFIHNLNTLNKRISFSKTV